MLGVSHIISISKMSGHYNSKYETHGSCVLRALAFVVYVVKALLFKFAASYGNVIADQVCACVCQLGH